MPPLGFLTNIISDAYSDWLTVINSLDRFSIAYWQISSISSYVNL
jgi:hypothetical protein